VRVLKSRFTSVLIALFAFTSLGLSPAVAVDERVIDIVTVTWPGATAPPADGNQIAKLINTEVNADWKKFTTLYGDTKDRAVSFVAGKVLETPISIAAKMPCTGLGATGFLDSIRPDAFKKLGVSDYSAHYLLIIAPKAGCVWSGRAQLGSYRSTNGTLVLHDASTSFVITHELGHTFGLGHTNFLRCDNGDADGQWGTTCKAVEYGGTIDVMGNKDTSSPLNTYHQWRMGFLDDSQVKQVWQSDVVNLAPSDFANGLRAIYIRDGNSAYWVEYRRTLDGVGYKPGLVIFRLDPPPTSAVVSPNAEDTTSEFDSLLGTDVWMLNLDSYKYKDSRSTSGSMTGLTATTFNGKISFSAVASETGAVLTIKRTADVTPPPVPVVVPAAQWKSPTMAILQEGNEDADTAIVGYESSIDGKVAALAVRDLEGWLPTYLSPFIAPKTVYVKDLPEGAYAFSVRAIDMQGNKSDWSKPEQVVIDRGDPVITNQFEISSVTNKEVNLAWKGATDSGSGICTVNLVDDEGYVIQSSTVKNVPSIKSTYGVPIKNTVEVFDCVGNGFASELSVSSNLNSLQKSSKTGKWSAATGYGASALKCTGKCSISVSAVGKNNVVVGTGAATVSLAGKSVASISDSKVAKARVGAIVDAGAKSKVLRISGSNFVVIGLLALTTTLGELRDYDLTAPVIDSSLDDPLQQELGKYGFRQTDFNNSWEVLPMVNGTTLKDPSLDLCNGTYASEKNRVERRQVLAIKSGSGYSFLSTEVVRYSSASAGAAAQKELQKAVSNCQLNKGYKDTTGTLVPYTFKDLGSLPTGLVAEGNRVLVYAEIDSAENKRTMLGFYQFNGEIFTGLYVMNSKGFTDAQVAKWLKVASTMADRLVGESV